MGDSLLDDDDSPLLDRHSLAPDLKFARAAGGEGVRPFFLTQRDRCDDVMRHITWMEAPTSARSRCMLGPAYPPYTYMY
jgi:hypothetical protein